jgi:hypothetical protein
VIIPYDELPTLCLEDSFEVANLIKFWEIMIVEFYDPHEGCIDMFLDYLFGPWGSFVCVEIVVRYVNEDVISFIILKIQI